VPGKEPLGKETPAPSRGVVLDLRLDDPRFQSPKNGPQMDTKIVKIGFNLKIGYPKLSWLIVFIPVEIA
jgi:hypothetical protein